MLVICVCAQLWSNVLLFVTPWSVARQAPLSMGPSRQEHWSELPFPSPWEKFMLLKETLKYWIGLSLPVKTQCNFLPLTRGTRVFSLCYKEKLTRYIWWLSSKESTCSARDRGLIPGLGRFPREGNDNPFQYSCLGNPMDREAWQAVVHRVAKRRIWLSD